MSDPLPRDVEQELWKVYSNLTTDSLDIADRQLKALERVVKIRSAGEKVKPVDGKGDRATVDAARKAARS